MKEIFKFVQDCTLKTYINYNLFHRTYFNLFFYSILYINIFYIILCDDIKFKYNKWKICDTYMHPKEI